MPNLLKKQVLQGFDLKDSNSPHYLREKLAGFPLSKLWFIGNPDILKRPLVGLFCSIRCPGNVILRTYDLARALREAGVPVIGGFHSPMEKECLDLLLRGRQPEVICPARSLARMRIPMGWRNPLAEGRLLIVSPFDEKHKRATVALADERNRLIARFSLRIFHTLCGPGRQNRPALPGPGHRRQAGLYLSSGRNRRVGPVRCHSNFIR